MPPRQTHALPAGYRLHWYVIESVLGHGGFGITYLARDSNLDQPVAIKEYLPVALATRSEDSQVHPISENHNDTYGWGMTRFLEEARTLARFRHPGQASAPGSKPPPVGETTPAPEDHDHDDPDHALAKLAGAAWIEGNVLWALGTLSVGLYYYFAAAFVVGRAERLLALASGEAVRPPRRAALLQGLYGAGLGAHVLGIGCGLYFAWLVATQAPGSEVAASAALLLGCVALWLGTGAQLTWFWTRARRITSRTLDLRKRGASLPVDWQVTRETLARSKGLLQRLLVFLAFFALDVYLISMLHTMIVNLVTSQVFDMAVLSQGLGLMVDLAMMLLIGGFVLVKTQVWLLLAPQEAHGGAVRRSDSRVAWVRRAVDAAFRLRARVDWFWVLQALNLVLVVLAFYLVHGDALTLLLGA